MSKDAIIKLRCTQAEKNAAEAIALARGVTVSELFRALLAKAAE
jgi:antitoxin component of RelBE/YafQ-DinJ toxin-antitoxin module